MLAPSLERANSASMQTSRELSTAMSSRRVASVTRSCKPSTEHVPLRFHRRPREANQNALLQLALSGAAAQAQQQQTQLPTTPTAPEPRPT